jgi:hypothetical protein
MSEEPQEPKPGVRTSEFWLALVVVVGGAIASVYQANPMAQVAGIAAAALASAGYGLSRAKVKQ